MKQHPRFPFLLPVLLLGLFAARAKALSGLIIEGVWSSNQKSQINNFLVWTFRIGGYPVCEKWLKDRKGRVLDYADLQHYQKTVVTLHETIRLMAAIDLTIETQGGWPGAFGGGGGDGRRPTRSTVTKGKCT